MEDKGCGEGCIQGTIRCLDEAESGVIQVGEG